jgi:hypothetical protein
LDNDQTVSLIEEVAKLLNSFRSSVGGVEKLSRGRLNGLEDVGQDFEEVWLFRGGVSGAEATVFSLGSSTGESDSLYR